MNTAHRLGIRCLLISAFGCGPLSLAGALNVSVGSLGDRVWWDQNRNGVQELGNAGSYAEPGIDGAVVRAVFDANRNGIFGDTAPLYGQQITDWVLSQTTRTIALPNGRVVSGFYRFNNLPSGNYRVTVASLPNGPWQQTWDMDDPSGWSMAFFTTPDSVGKYGLPMHVIESINADGDLVGTYVVANSSEMDFGYTLREFGPDPGPLATYTQGGWGSRPCGNNPGQLLAGRFAGLYPTGLVVGVGYTLTFTSAKAVEDFLPAGTKAGALRRNYTDPVGRTEGGVLAGQTVALRLNVDFSVAGITEQGLWGQHVLYGPLAGLTVDDVLYYCETALGGGATPFSIAELVEAATAINENYDGGKVDNGFLGP